MPLTEIPRWTVARSTSDEASSLANLVGRRPPRQSTLEKNTTIVFPVPLDLLSPLLQGVSSQAMSRNGKRRPEEPSDAPLREEVMV